MTNTAVESLLLDSLHAYVKEIEIPNNEDDLLAIASSILTFQLKQANKSLPPNLAELLTQQVVNQFNANAVFNSVINSATKEFVGKAKWRHSLENQVLETLNSYVQEYRPQGITNLSETILSIIPLVESVLLGKFQVNSLIQQVTKEFDLQTALGQIIGEDTLAIAQKLADFLQFGSLEKLLEETIIENQPLLDQAIESIAESFVNTELAKILGSNKFKFDIDLDTQQLMVKQVTFKFNILQSPPPPPKSLDEFGKEIDIAAEIFKVKQKLAIDAKKIPT
jgi:hypothetical protein